MDRRSRANRVASPDGFYPEGRLPRTSVMVGVEGSVGCRLSLDPAW